MAATDGYLRAPTTVPEEISDRQFFHGLAKQGIISQAEALEAVGPGILPAALDALVEQMPEADRFDVRMLLRGATIFQRSHPMTAALAAAFGWGSADTDEFWRFCTGL